LDKSKDGWIRGINDEWGVKNWGKCGFDNDQSERAKRREEGWVSVLKWVNENLTITSHLFNYFKYFFSFLYWFETAQKVDLVHKRSLFIMNKVKKNRFIKESLNQRRKIWKAF